MSELNNKYKLLNASLDAISNGAFSLLIARGDPGMGKTHNILKFVKERGVDYAYIKTYSTPLKFYELLYRNRDKQVIIFDDLSNISDPKILGMLKSACWAAAGEQRDVSYYTTSKLFSKLDIPSTFKMGASIVLVFNEIIPNLAPIVNRGINIDFEFNFSDKVDIFKRLGEENIIDEEILNYIGSSCSESTKNLSIRSLVILSDIKKKGFEWEIFATEMLKEDKDVGLLLSLISDSDSTKDACEKWMSVTGKSRSTFMRELRRIKK